MNEQPQKDNPTPVTPSETWRSVAMNATTQEPDDYLQVSSSGEVRLNGAALTEEQDPNILRWAACAIADFLTTGKLAPIPG